MWLRFTNTTLSAINYVLKGACALLTFRSLGRVLFQVRNHLQRERRIFAHVRDGRIATVAEQFPNLTRRVVVIDAEVRERATRPAFRKSPHRLLLRRLRADRAHAALRLNQSVVIGQRDSVRGLERMMTSRLVVPSGSMPLRATRLAMAGVSAPGLLSRRELGSRFILPAY